MNDWKIIPVTLVSLLLLETLAFGQLEFEQPPIAYSASVAHNDITRLQNLLDEQKVALAFDDDHQYLRAVLKELKIPESSQTLVFSKTSLQLRRISPDRPRAIYFNDNNYVGWVQGGDVIEVSTVDPELGAVFYTLTTSQVDQPSFIRDQGQCLTCHASSRTAGVPGHLMRSVFVDRTGQPHFGSGTYTTTQSSPFDRRWGGWYVTGTYGSLRHMGNVVAEKHARVETLDREPGANVTDLSQFIDASPYLQPTSDVVALMVLGHQLEMHNLITRANFETRSALHYNDIMNAALKRDDDYVSESTDRRIASAGEKLLNCLLFADEAPLEEPVHGGSTFVDDFAEPGPRDSSGRSLREFDLQRRLFKYPCSYLIYTESFDAMPTLMKDYVARRLAEILIGKDESEEFEHLSESDRAQILEILKETKPDLLSGV